VAATCFVRDGAGKEQEDQMTREKVELIAGIYMRANNPNPDCDNRDNSGKVTK